MYLSKLEIFGFKSFANRTVINYTKGITGIVGPNGCGKTNIVDALRWCLGEQKSSTLRSDKMENVIFNGTRSKKPMGMAEVSLTLVNDDGALPSDYTEVTITRRIFRSGESEYLLNKNVCRLKDITNLFMDTGMGTNAYSVIELKMVETILSNKADERRRMFEEAAGVNKYKLRRRHTLKKLEEVKSDLTRVNDIVSEVEKNVRSLERQAKKADKYNQIQSVLREKELDLAERQFTAYTLEIRQLSEQKESFTKRKGELELEMKNFEIELLEYKDKIAEVEKRLRSKQMEISQKTEKLHETQKNISVAEERRKSQRNNLDRFKKELEELVVEKTDTEDLIIENKARIDDYRESITQKQNEVAESETDLSSKKEIFETKRNLLKQKNEEELSKYKDITQQENQLSNLQKNKATAQKSVENLRKRISGFDELIANTETKKEELSNSRDEVSGELNSSKAVLLKSEALKLELEKEIASLKEREIEERSVFHGLRDKVEFLQSLIDNLEGMSNASKKLIESEDWAQKNKTVFADVGHSKEEYKFALEASLKVFLNNLLIENSNDLMNAISLLKTKDLGKASFYLLRNKDQKKNLIDYLRRFRDKRYIKLIEQHAGFINWAFNLVKTSGKWKPYFEQALSSFVVVKDLKSALELSNDYPRFSFATVDGDVVYNNGVVEAGSLPKLDETLFGRRQMVADLKKNLPTHEESLNQLREQIVKKEEELSGIDLKTPAQKIKEFEQRITEIEKQYSQREYEIEKAKESISGAEGEIKSVESEISGLDKNISELDELIKDRQAEKRLSEEKLSELEEELGVSQDEFNDAVTLLNQRKVEQERLKGQLQNIINSIDRAEKALTSMINGIEKRKTDITDTEGELTALNSMIDDKQIAYDEIYTERQALVLEETGIDEELRGIKREASKFETELTKFRNEKQEILDNVHKYDIQINEKQYRITTLYENIKEEYNIDLELKEYDDLDSFDFRGVAKEVHSLKDQLKNLGPINLLAYSEYEEEKERMDFLHKQRDDLVHSEKDLLKTIDEINDTAQQLFADTFLEVRDNFRKIFRTLFDPGDEADLLIEEDVDPLDAKIEIVAKPKGKRPTSIELLSGGEKTLTATALLFAIYLVKPSPFCILDEVDAPLDDANIDRFTNLLREFSARTQFILVTHNKRTMEAAENMYGVTMQEEGISKLAAVQFNEELPVE
ncbi:MAG: chromosome partition protein Smc [Melioribacteraceae bacterium]|nr:MAG: chromosome partition protein Smc [Melioribacteraceae bacterium]